MSRRRRARGQGAWHSYLRAARRQGAKLPKKGTRQTLHDRRIWAKRVAEGRRMIAVEDNKSLFLATSTMARKGAAIGAAKTELIEDGTRAGARTMLVAHAHPVMTRPGRWPRHA